MDTTSQEKAANFNVAKPLQKIFANGKNRSGWRDSAEPELYCGDSL